MLLNKFQIHCYTRLHQPRKSDNIIAEKHQDLSEVNMVECQAYQTVVKTTASATTERMQPEAASVYEAIWHYWYFVYSIIIIAA